MTKVLVLNTGGPWPLPHWPRSLSLDRSLQRRAQSLPLTATPDQVPGFHLAFLSVSAGLFGPCHLVRKVEGAELPQDRGCTSPRGQGLAFPSDWLSGSLLRLELQEGPTAILSSPPVKDVLLSCWRCRCGTLSGEPDLAWKEMRNDGSCWGFTQTLTSKNSLKLQWPGLRQERLPNLQPRRPRRVL